jgi:hypothetical protein
MSGRSRRLRAALDREFTAVVVVLLLLALVGGWVTYATHVDPGTTTEERVASTWQTAGWFNHSSVVSEPNSVYPAGTELHERSVYLARITPYLTGAYTFGYEASEGGNLTGTVDLRMMQVSVQEERRNETVIWRTSRSLRTATADGIAPGETVSVPFAVNVNETMTEVAAIENELGNPPGEPRVLLRATVTLEGTVNDAPVDRTVQYTLPIALGDGVYRPGSPGEMVDQYEDPRTVVVQRTYGPLRRLGGPALLAGAVVGLAALGVGRVRGNFDLTEAERERLRFDEERAEFDEWISPIALPDEAFDLPRAEASSLASLVDFAIDTDTRVVEHPASGVFYVRHDGYLYTYRPPTAVAVGTTRNAETPGEDRDSTSTVPPDDGPGADDEGEEAG